MRQAFTMIELIFVITIIGILSAVAIPKLAATRTDAKVAAMANEITSVANEVASRAVASGVSSDIPSMSKMATVMINAGRASYNNNVLEVHMGNVSDCIKLQIVSDSRDMNLTMSYSNAGSDTACASLQQTVQAAKYPIPLGGKRLAW